MTKLTLIGAGGHGKVAAEIAQINGYDDLVFLDERWPDVKIIGSWPIIGKPPGVNKNSRIFVSIGDNSTRSRLCATHEPEDQPYLLHPNAILSPTVTIRPGTLIAAGVIINIDAHIGQGVILNTACCVDHDCKIADFVHISPGAQLAGNVTIGARSWIGIGAIVKEGIAIGTDVTVGAGAVVLSDIPDGQTVVGNPAKPF